MGYSDTGHDKERRRRIQRWRTQTTIIRPTTVIRPTERSATTRTTIMLPSHAMPTALISRLTSCPGPAPPSTSLTACLSASCPLYRLQLGQTTNVQTSGLSVINSTQSKLCLHECKANDNCICCDGCQCWLHATCVNIKYKKLISLQYRVRASKPHIQNSTNHFARIIW